MVVTRNDHNAAIGKGSALGAILRYLPSYFSLKWKKIVRERFFLRMGAYLPKATTRDGKKDRLFYLILMPSSIGGMGLYIDIQEFKSALHELPVIVKKLLWFNERKADFEDSDYRLSQGFSLVRKWLTYGSYRAYLSDSLEGDTLRNLDLELAIKDTLQCSSFRELFQQLGSAEKDAMFINDSIALRGFEPIRDTVDTLKRGYLFQSILTGHSLIDAFKTTPLRKRFATLWDVIEKVCNPLFSQCGVGDYPDDFIIDEVKSSYFITGEERSTYYVNIQQVLKIDYFSISENRQITIESKVIDQITNGLPLLRIPLNEMGFY